jgi:spermidine synthase
LDFEYLQWMAAAVQTCFDATTPLRALHLGAGGCALAWHWDVTRPGSRQVAVEIDAELAGLARSWFALPRAPRLRIQVGDAACVITGRRDASADVVVRDVFANGVTPAALAATPFLAHARRVLAPGGLYLANVASGPGRAVLAAEVASVAEVFPYVAVIAETAMLRGRRFANSVIVARDAPLDCGGLHRAAARAGVAVRVVDASSGTLGSARSGSW